MRGRVFHEYRSLLSVMEEDSALRVKGFMLIEQQRICRIYGKYC